MAGTVHIDFAIAAKISFESRYEAVTNIGGQKKSSGRQTLAGKTRGGKKHESNFGCCAGIDLMEYSTFSSVRGKREVKRFSGNVYYTETERE